MNKKRSETSRRATKAATASIPSWRRSLLNAIAVILFTGTLAASGRAESRSTESGFQICEFNPQTEQTTVLFNVPDASAVTSIDWNSQSQQLALSIVRKAADGQSQNVIRICRRDGSEMQDIGRGELPSWSPRGRRLTYSRQGPDGGVWIMRSDGTDAQILDSKGWSARWSPDGNKIAYLRTDNGRSEVRIFNLVESRFRRIRWGESPEDVRISEGFSWAPDSSHICCQRTVGNGPPKLTIIGVDREQQTVVEENIGDFHPQLNWHRDNAILVAQKRSDVFQLAEIRLTDDNAFADLREVAGNAGESSDDNPVFDHRSSTILFVRSRWN